MVKEKRICLWSGPQHPAYPLMLAFAQRKDTRIVDRPFQAHYLQRTGAMPPEREEVLDAFDSRPDQIIHQLQGSKEKSHLFLHEIPLHLLGVNLNFLSSFHHVMLIRHPRALRVHASQVLEAYTMQHRLYHLLLAGGSRVMVIDTRTLALDPEYTLTSICHHVGIPYKTQMMRWYKRGDLQSLYSPSQGQTDYMMGEEEDQAYEKCFDCYVDLLTQAESTKETDEQNSILVA